MINLNRAPVRFIIIDDDPISNLLCQISIKTFYEKAEIETFTLPDKGFEFIVREYKEKINNQPVMLFLDINMPIWSGWDFLNFFEKLDAAIKARFKIYIMSSSIDDADKLKAATNENVIDYITKPCSKSCLLAIFNKITEEE